MNTQAVHKIIEPLELDSEVKARIITLLSPFKDDEAVPQKIVDQVVELLDLEVETNELLAQAYEKTGQDVDQYLDDIDKATNPTP